MIIYVDIDDTICKSPENTSLVDKYLKAEPLYEKIKLINNLYDKGHTIIYWTARGTLSNINFFELTYNQLKLWNVKFHELRMGKPAFDLLIDDKTFNITNPEIFDNLIHNK